MKSCIYCGNVIDNKDERCPYCGREQLLDRREPLKSDVPSQNPSAPAYDDRRININSPAPQETILFDFDKLNLSVEQPSKTPDSNDIYSNRRDLGDPRMSDPDYGYEDNRQMDRMPQKKELNKPFIIGMSIAGVIIIILVILLFVVAGSNDSDPEPTEPASVPVTTAVPETSIPITSAPPITEPTTEITTALETTDAEEETTEEEYTTEPPIVISSPLSGIWMTNVVLGNGQTAEDICTFRGDGTMNVTVESAEISIEGTYTVDGDTINTSISLLGSNASGTYSYTIDGNSLTTTDSQGNQIIFQKIQ